MIEAEMMNMEMNKLIARINELAYKAKTQELTYEERLERAALREEYLNIFRARFCTQLDNTYVLDSNGKKQKLSEYNAMR